MTLTLLIISFILDGIFSNILPINSLFNPLFTLIALIVVFPYYNEEKKYYKHAFFIGLAYDLIYTDTMIFYAFLFLFFSFLISKATLLIADNYFGLMILSLFFIALFRIVTYICLIVTGNINFDLEVLFRSVYTSIIPNLIFALILNMITNIIRKKLKIRKSIRY